MNGSEIHLSVFSNIFCESLEILLDAGCNSRCLREGALIQIKIEEIDRRELLCNMVLWRSSGVNDDIGICVRKYVSRAVVWSWINARALIYTFKMTPAICLIVFHVCGQMFGPFCLPGTRLAARKYFITFPFQLLAASASTRWIAWRIIKFHCATNSDRQ